MDLLLFFVLFYCGLNILGFAMLVGQNKKLVDARRTLTKCGFQCQVEFEVIAVFHLNVEH